MSRASWLFIFIVVFIAVAALHAGEAWLQFFALLIVDGGLSLLWIASATMLGLALIPLTGPLRFPTAAALGLGIYSVAALLLGLAGLLNRWTALALPVISVIVFLIRVLPRLRAMSLDLLRQRCEAWLNARPMHWWAWLLPVTSLAAAAVAASMPPGVMWQRAGDPHPYDVVEYHLQVPREWQQGGRILPLEHNVYCFFPANLEMQYLLTMHIARDPWKPMYVAHFITLGYGILSVVAVYAAARALLPLPANDLSPPLAAAAMACVPWLVMLSSVAYNEAGLVLYITLAVAWLIHGVTNPIARRWSFMLAGVMAGLACGVKYTAVPIAALLFLLVLLFPWRMARLPLSAGDILGGSALFAIGAALAFSPWLIRNLKWTGNPVFPEAMTIFGRGHFSEDQQHRWERAHQPTEMQRPISKRLAAFVREVLRDQRYAGIFWMVLVMVLLVARWTVAGAVAAILWVALTAFWLLLTHLQSRFFILGVPLSAVLLAQPARHRVGAIVQLVLSIAVMLAGSVVTHSLLIGQLHRVSFLIGQEDLSIFLDKSVQSHVRGKSNLALVGDARAFLYTTPPSRLHYRTIFDVDKKPAQPIIDAWLGPDAARLRRECHIIVDEDELDRLYTTYILGLPWQPPPRPTPPKIIPPQR